MKFSSLSCLLAAAGAAGAQYFPPTPENVTKVNSQVQDGVYISYKEVRKLV
jgi:hypothetical protein